MKKISGNYKNENSDFIERYKKLLSRITDAPSEYQEAAMLFLISTALGRNWTFKSIPDTPLFSKKQRTGGRLLNLWYIILGKSRTSRKTSGVIRHVHDMLTEILDSDKELTNSFTPEFLIKEMAGKTQDKADIKVTECYWIKDEVAGFFKLVRKRESYMADIDDVLSSIYDGTSVTRGTIGREKESVLNPYLTCFLASTNFLPTLFDETQIRLGFLNRFIYVVGIKRNRKELRIKDLSGAEQRDIKEIKVFLRRLVKLDKAVTMEMTEEAMQVYNSYEDTLEDRIERENLDIKEGYCGQLPNLVIRLSCLYRISRMSLAETVDFETTVIVEKQDVERAIQYANKAWNWFEEIVQIMQSSSNKKLPAIEQAKRAILELLEDGREHHYREIIKYVNERVGIKSANTYNAINSLVDEGKIVRTKPGYYRLKIAKAKNTEGT